MIVLTAPTGHIGSKVVANLMQSKEELRLIARNPSKLSAEIKNRAEIIEGSHSDGEVLEKAFAGASTLFWLVAGDPTAPDAFTSYAGFSKPACELLKKSSIRHVVGISALGRGWPRDTGYVSGTLALDDQIAATGVNYRALECPSLMENILRSVATIKEQGVFYGVNPPELKAPLCATKDAADAASQLLLRRDWSGVEGLPLLGPEDLSSNDMAQIISDVIRKPVRYQEIPMADFHAMLLKRGTTPGMAQAMVNMMIAKNEGLDSLVKRSAENSTPTSFRAWCETELKPALAT